LTVGGNVLVNGNLIGEDAAASPTAAPTVALAGIGAGNVDNGDHDYIVTYVTAFGETASGPIVTVTVTDNSTDGKVLITDIPVGPPGTIARKIYRSPEFSGLNFEGFNLLTTINDNTTTTYTDNTADADLGAPYLSVYNGADYGGNFTGNTLYDGSNWVLNYANTGDGTGGVINANVAGNGFNFIDPTMAVGNSSAYGDLLENNQGFGGLGIYGNALAAGGAPALQFEGFITGTSQLPSTQPAFQFSAIRSNNNSMNDGETIMSVNNDDALVGGQPSFNIVSQWNGIWAGGFPEGGVRVGINDNAPTAVLSVVDPTTPDAPHLDKVVLALQGSDTQTADLLRLLDSNGTVLSKFDANGDLSVGTSTSPTNGVATFNGNVGIGTTTPYSRLQVTGSDAASSTSAFAVVNSASTTVFAVFDGGNAELSGTLTQSSDQRLKTNIQSLDASSSLSLIDQLNPVTFNWIDPDEGTTPQLGFIAQQVQQVFPNLVSTTSATALTPGGTLGLNYGCC